MKPIAMGLALVCCLLFAPSLVAQEESAPAPAETVEPGEDDEQIAGRIRDIMAELEGYDGVAVAVRSGVVTLSGEVVDQTELAELDALIRDIDGVVALRDNVTGTTDLSKRLTPALDRMQARLQQAIAFLPLVAVALGAAVVIWLIGLRISRLHQPWDRLAPNAFIANIYRQIVLLLFILGGIVIALDILNATALLGTILGAAGIIGLAIGFAVRDTVENFIASIMLSVRQPFQPNDTVEINGDEGKVIRLTSRATILLSLDGNHIRIPNATVFKSRIVNFTRNAERRFQFDIGVEADSDLARVREVIEETVAAMPFTLDRAGTGVWIKDMTDAGVVFTVTGWIDQSTTSLLRARGETLRLVKHAIEAGGFAIPDTTYRIRMEAPGLSMTQQPQEAGPQDPLPPAPVAPAATGVETVDDRALDPMIAAERDDRTNPDLLRSDAPTE